MPVDYDYELSNGWDKWQNVVLLGLKEIKQDLKDLHSVQTNQGTDIALIKQSLAEEVDYEPRLQKLEQDVATKDEIKLNQRWLVGTALAIVGSILVPLLVVATTSIFG